ncbi:MAG: CRTAC1 family protein [Gemmataceae bacterium]
MNSSWPRVGGIVGLAALLAGVWACNGGSPPAVAPAPGPSAPADPPEATGPDWFADVTAASGVDAVYHNGEEVKPPHLSILESLGGGLAAIDFDGDGLLDLYFPGGGHFGGKDNKDILGHAGKLYRNEGNFKFRDVTAAAGLATLAGGKPWFYSHAAAVGDYDRDGWPDLLVTGWGRVALFRNVPDGKGGRKFEDVSAAAGLDKGVIWATSAAWADFDGDGFPDLYVCQYVDWSWAKNPACNYDGKTPDVCPPKEFFGLPHKVYRNNGDGTFADVSAAAGLNKGGEGVSKGLGVVVVDVDGDGKPDVYVANDTVPNFLYMNKSARGKIAFEERGMAAMVALDAGGGPNGSMGTDAADPEGTGKPALWCTNYENELHALYRNASDAKRGVFFQHVSTGAGLSALGQKFVGWGTGYVDFDLDGWEDLFIANGHAIRFPTGATRLQRPVLMFNRGKGRFADISKRGGAYFAGPHLSRGVVLADLDNDGRVDAVVSHMNSPAAVLKNVAPAGNHWLGVRLVGAKNADVVGAKVEATANGRTMARFAKGGGSYASAPDKRLVFGLGPADKAAKLAVTWPDGSRQEWADVPADQYVVLTQGEKAFRTDGKKP